MPIRRLLRDSKRGPDAIEILTRAFDHALRSVSLVDRGDPLAEMLARQVLPFDPAVIAQAVLPHFENWQA